MPPTQTLAPRLLLAGRAASGGLASGRCVVSGGGGGGGGVSGVAPTSTTGRACYASWGGPGGLGRVSGSLAPPCTASIHYTPGVGDQRRWFRLRDLFDKDKAAARRASISEDIARGHFDDLAGSKTVDKPYPARAFPFGPARPILPPLACIEGRAPSDVVDWRAWLAPGTLLLVGLRASAEAGLDSWAAAYTERVGGGGNGDHSPRIVDLTINDRTPALALALPGMKTALVRGAAAGAARRGAAVSAVHFGPAREVRDALGLTNALAAHAVVVGRCGGVAWVGAGVASEEEVEGMVGVVGEEGGW